MRNLHVSLLEMEFLVGAVSDAELDSNAKLRR